MNMIIKFNDLIKKILTESIEQIDPRITLSKVDPSINHHTNSNTTGPSTLPITPDPSIGDSTYNTIDPSIHSIPKLTNTNSNPHTDPLQTFPSVPAAPMRPQYNIYLGSASF